MAGWTWKQREAQRLRRGTYDRLPFSGAGWYHMGPGPKEHYAHISKDDPSKIAYTESAVKGKLDVQIKVRPGRYLKRFYDNILTENQIRDHATNVTSKVKDSELKIAMLPNDIEHVYRNGPGSCMSYGISSFDSGIHPTRIYGAGDLGVAYIERKGRITARALCWPDKKRYTRIYGDSARLEPELSARGFLQFTDMGDKCAFDGARMLKVEERRYSRNNFVVPYVDYHKTMREEGDFLVFDDDGPLSCGQTNGLVPVCRGIKCKECAEFSEAEFVLMYDTDTSWCPSCAESRGWTCYHCKNICGGTRAFHLGTRQRLICTVCEPNYFKCEGCDIYKITSDGETILVRLEDDIETHKLCNVCIPNDFVQAWCEYFYLMKNLDTRDCGCNTCNARELEIQGQFSFEGMPFIPGRPPVEFSQYCEINTMAPSVRA